MAQVARNQTDGVDGFLLNHRVLIRDRDCLFTARFTNVLEGAGVKNLFTPVRAPNCNAYAERLVLTIKSECLGKIILFGKNSLRRACNEFVERYHTGVRARGSETSGSSAVRRWAVVRSSVQSALAAF